MKDLWVSADGSWGVNQVKKFDTTNWLDKDWDRLDAECDRDKLKLAKYITRKRNKQAKRAQEAQEWTSRFNPDGWPVDPFDLQFPEVRTFIIGPDGVEEIK
jgi:hypothetical protein